MNFKNPKELLDFTKYHFPDNCQKHHHCTTDKTKFCKNHKYCLQFQIEYTGSILTKMEYCSKCMKNKAPDKLSKILQNYQQGIRENELSTISNSPIIPNQDGFSLNTYFERKSDSFKQKLLGRFRSCFLCSQNRKEFFKTCNKHKLCIECFNDIIKTECIPERLYCNDCCLFFGENISIKTFQMQIDDNSKQSNKNSQIVLKNNEISSPPQNSVLVSVAPDISSELVCSKTIKPNNKGCSGNLIEKSEIPNIRNSMNQSDIYSNYTSHKIHDDFKSVLIFLPSCHKCKVQGKVYGFICNHNLCLKCLCDGGYNQIFEYFKQYRAGGLKEKFNYRCPAQGCHEIISIATSMILKFIYKEDIVSERYMNDHILLNIGFYDGIDDHLIID